MARGIWKTGGSDTSRSKTVRYHDEVSNPFVFAYPVSTPQFTDREVELKALIALMRDGQGAILVSPRRYGKTSLLQKALEMAAKDKDRRVRAGMVSLAEVLDAQGARGIAERIATGVLFGPLGGLEGKLKGFARLVEAVRPKVSVTTGEDGKPRVSLESTRAEEDWWDAIRDTIGLLAKLRGEGYRPVLVIDEFQRAEELAPGFGWVFKDMTDQVKGVSLVLSGSKRHAMEQLATGPLQRVGPPIHLGKIDQPIMVRHVQKLARGGGKEMEAAVATSIFDLMDGIPKDVQELAYWAYEAADERPAIDAADVEAALGMAVAMRSDGFATRINGLANVQARVVLRLAQKPERQPNSRAFMSAVGAGSTTAVRKALVALEEQELVERSPDGEWRLTDPMLRHWIVRRASPRGRVGICTFPRPGGMLEAGTPIGWRRTYPAMRGSPNRLSIPRSKRPISSSTSDPGPSHRGSSRRASSAGPRSRPRGRPGRFGSQSCRRHRPTARQPSDPRFEPKRGGTASSLECRGRGWPVGPTPRGYSTFAAECGMGVHGRPPRP